MTLYPLTELRYAEQHAAKLIESLERAGSQQLLERAISLRSLPESSGTKQAARMYGDV